MLYIQSKCIGELVFKTQVLAVKLRRDRVVIVLLNKVYIYRFSDLKLIDQIPTSANPRGLIALCPETNNNILAVPGLGQGTVRIELYDIAKTSIIKAHDTDLAQFALNVDGTRIITASEKGTLLRLWNTMTGEILKEFRRGSDRAEIYCLVFNIYTTYIACSSDKGTVHIFAINTDSVEVPDKPSLSPSPVIPTSLTSVPSAESAPTSTEQPTRAVTVTAAAGSADKYKAAGTGDREKLPTGIIHGCYNIFLCAAYHSVHSLLMHTRITSMFMCIFTYTPYTYAYYMTYIYMLCIYRDDGTALYHLSCHYY